MSETMSVRRRWLLAPRTFPLSMAWYAAAWTIATDEDIFAYAPESDGAQAYGHLAVEIVRRVRTDEQGR